MSHSHQYNKCYFCDGNHICRECPIETKLAPVFKKKVGVMMEQWIGNNLKCPNCNHPDLFVVGDNSPSLDIICNNCSSKFEVKSKCLSVNVLPPDIKLPHGSYRDFCERLDDGLGLIVIIYGIDRVNKLIKIREVLYANNTIFRNENIIKVDRRVDRYNHGLSTIYIKNKLHLPKLRLKDNVVMSFSEEYNSLVSRI
jgi:hypothetical protein